MSESHSQKSFFLSESELFSKFTGNAEVKVPEIHPSGESERSGPVERSGTDIYAGKPRVRSIMSKEEEGKRAQTVTVCRTNVI
jgi:hypothetical protein